MGLFEDLNRDGWLALGMQPEWVDQTTYDGPPASLTEGVSLQDAPVALISVDLRAEVHRRTSRVVITTADLTTTVYTVTIDGNAVNYDASAGLPASATALVSAIAAAINADGTVGPIVSAVADPLAPTTTILITGDTDADYSIDASVAGGTGALTKNADACSATVRFYGTADGLIQSGSTGSASRWRKAANAEWSIDFRGFVERLDVAGLGKGYVELDDIDGHASDGGAVTYNVARVMVGPSVLEATT